MIATVNIGGFSSTAVVVSPDGHVYAVQTASNFDSYVSVIEVATYAVSTIALQSRSTPLGVAVNDDGSRVYTANFDNHTVAVIGY